MLQEIVRSPELIKCLTGTSLKGSIDPAYDKLNKTERQKLEQLDDFERKGYDYDTIQNLRKQLVDKPTRDKLNPK